MFQSQNQNREPLCLISQNFLIPPTFARVGLFGTDFEEFWGKRPQLRICAIGFLHRHQTSARVMFIGTSTDLSLCLLSRTLLFPWLASWQSETAGQISSCRGYSGEAVFWGHWSEVRIWEWGRKITNVPRFIPCISGWAQEKAVCSSAHRNSATVHVRAHAFPSPGNCWLVARDSGSWVKKSPLGGLGGRRQDLLASEQLGHFFLDFALRTKNHLLQINLWGNNNKNAFCPVSGSYRYQMHILSHN